MQVLYSKLMGHLLVDTWFGIPCNYLCAHNISSDYYHHVFMYKIKDFSNITFIEALVV